MDQLSQLKECIRVNDVICNTSMRVVINEELEMQEPALFLERIVKEGGTAYIDDVRIRENQVMFGGILDYEVMFIEKRLGCPQGMMGQIRFEEVMKMPGLQEQDNVMLRVCVDWISARVINDRKLLLKGQLTVYGTATGTKSLDVVADVGDQDDIQVLKKKIECINLVKEKADTFRIKDKWTIPAGKSSVQKIIWKDIKVKNVTTKLGEGNLNIAGELYAFIMYLPEDETQQQQWHETIIPFSGIVDVSGAEMGDQSELISYVDVKLQSVELNPTCNDMGENKEIEVDLILKLDIKIYREMEMEVITDMYSLSNNLTPVKNQGTYNKLLVKNTSRSRNVVKINLDGDKGDILQICGSGADVKIDDISVSGDGLVAQGKITAYVLYASSDDRDPVCTASKEMEFTHRIDAEEISKDDDFYVNWRVEQATANMISAGEIEIRVIIVMEAFVFKKCKEFFVTDSREEGENRYNIPFIRAHVVQKGESLWTLAKENKTTVDRIRQLNNLKAEQVQAGERIIVAKH